MREILFRGKRIDNGEWVYGDICHHDGVVSYIGQHPADGSMVCYDIEPETVGQFTGLSDKNGKRIFEGDIIRVGRSYMFDDDDCKAEIGVGIVTLGIGTFDMGFYRYLGWHCKKSDGDVDSYPIVDCDEDWISEVIGSIHDNPELLEVIGDE